MNVPPPAAWGIAILIPEAWMGDIWARVSQCQQSLVAIPQSVETATDNMWPARYRPAVMSGAWRGSRASSRMPSTWDSARSVARRGFIGVPGFDSPFSNFWYVYLEIPAAWA